VLGDLRAVLGKEVEALGEVHPLVAEAVAAEVPAGGSGEIGEGDGQVIEGTPPVASAEEPGEEA
jgi:hypothetical protein